MQRASHLLSEAATPYQHDTPLSIDFLEPSRTPGGLPELQTF